MNGVGSQSILHTGVKVQRSCNLKVSWFTSIQNMKCITDRHGTHRMGRVMSSYWVVRQSNVGPKTRSFTMENPAMGELALGREGNG